jgi:predicted SAM-dependent methyltransferase
MVEKTETAAIQCYVEYNFSTEFLNIALDGGVMQSDKSLKLNIGAGITYIPGFVNIDVTDRADTCLDLNHERLPFDDNSVDLIFTNHTIEHLHGYLHAIGEMHRVLRHGGELLVGVPYVTLTEFNLVNPYHKQHFNEFSFDFFDPEHMLGSAAESSGVMFHKVCHRFHYMPEFINEPPDKKEWYRRHCFNVVREITFGVMAIKDKDKPLPIDKDTSQRLLHKYDECMAARVPYDRLDCNHRINSGASADTSV